MSEDDMPSQLPPLRRNTRPASSGLGPRSRSSDSVISGVDDLMAEQKREAEEDAERQQQEVAKKDEAKRKKKKLAEAKKARAAKMKELMDNGEAARKAKQQRIREAKKKHGTYQHHWERII